MVSQEQIRRYREDGATPLRGVIAPEWVERLRAGVEANLAEPGPYAKLYTPEGQPGKFFGDYCNWPRIPDYKAFFVESGLAAVAAELMGSAKVNLYHEHVLVKEPGTREKTPWHHDQPYYPVDGEQIVSFWIPLDPVARSTCPQYVAGSHRWGKWYAPKRFADSQDHSNPSADYESVPDEDTLRREHTLLAWDLEPGDCIAFHGLTLHGAPGNEHSGRRRAFAARFTGDDARFVLRQGFMSPPPPPAGGPVSGDAMDSEAFPVIWRAGRAAGLRADGTIVTV
ncbi:MAG: phytanoyl-CoA dioxygenase family protein [Burkholderiales bacterium]|nr:MAG: phytanoyl-CoA dioxygenase family protein [Burkholderiales bacterium]